MPKIKLEHIVSCSSEDPDHAANNLLNSETKKKWKSQTTGLASVSVIIQIEKASKISGVDIGNENSSFIEVLVGRSTSQEQDYKILMAMSSFMTPMEARNLTNCNRVRMFTYDDLETSVRDEKWDRIKIVCTQPFNKHIQYGLSFISLHSPKEKKDDELNMSLGKFTLRPESPVEAVGSLFAKRKELTDSSEKKPIVQAMKTFGTPKNKIVNIQSSSTKKPSESEVKNRNRKNLFYDSEDDIPNEKIDNVIEKVKEEEENKKVKRKTPNKLTDKETENKNDISKPNSLKKDKIGAKYSTVISKRKTDTPSNSPNKKRKVTKPFNQLLNGVIFTISGIVNPERANLRTLALNMGAKYKPDWDNSCTHLICAFANTPKFNQVRGKGKIVTKLWIKDCSDKRKRLPWRRYALDKNDQGKPESEEEIDEIGESERNESPIEEVEDKSKDTNNTSNKMKDPFESDTDEEIERVLKQQKNGSNTNNETKNDINSSVEDSFEPDTDEEIERVLKQQKNENETKNITNNTAKNSFDADTDEEELEKNPAKIKEEIPKLFKTEIFYIEDVFDENEKNKLQRLIKAFDGVILTTLRNIVDFVITTEEDMLNKKDRNINFKYVNYLWIYECHNNLKRIPSKEFELTVT